MKKILPALGALALLAACTSVPLEEPQTPGSAVAPADDIALQPLTVPALSALPETSPRPLQGRFVAVDWQSLPGWNDDDLRHVWKGFINNCKGLMRPVAGTLSQPARATPR